MLRSWLGFFWKEHPIGGTGGVLRAIKVKSVICFRTKNMHLSKRKQSLVATSKSVSEPGAQTFSTTDFLPGIASGGRAAKDVAGDRK